MASTMDPEDEKARNNWNEETLAVAAASCRTRGEFKGQFPGGYNQAIKYGLLDQICSHMTSPYRAWDDEALLAEARRFISKAEFRAGSPNAYAAAIRQHKMGILSAHFTLPTTGLGTHLVYRLRFRQGIYIGLTCTSSLRRKYHEKRGTVARYMRETGEKLPEMEIIADGLSPSEASSIEIREIEAARSAGIVLLNKAGGGQLGAFGRSVWTRDRVLAEGRKYSTRTEFKLGSSTAYSHAREQGWLRDACEHMRHLRKTYTDADLAQIAGRFTNRGSFQRYERAGYNAARSRQILDRVCGHMVGGRTD